MSELESLKRDWGRLKEENEQLREENRLLKLQLQELRQNLFKKNTPQSDEDDEKPHFPKKRGAPSGHPGQTRPVPEHCDTQVDVELSQCPKCGSRKQQPVFSNFYAKTSKKS